MKSIYLIAALLVSITGYAEVICETKMILNRQTGQSYPREVCLNCELREVYDPQTARTVVRKVCTPIVREN